MNYDPYGHLRSQLALVSLVGGRCDAWRAPIPVSARLQCYEGRPFLEFDRTRVVRSGLVGFFLHGSLSHYYYHFCEVRPAGRLKNSKRKLSPVPEVFRVKKGEGGRGWWDGWVGDSAKQADRIRHSVTSSWNGFRELGTFSPPGAVAFSFQGVVGGPGEGGIRPDCVVGGVELHLLCRTRPAAVREPSYHLQGAETDLFPPSHGENRRGVEQDPVGW